MSQSEPMPDLTFEKRLGIEADGMRMELIAAVGETIDSTSSGCPSTGPRLISNLSAPCSRISRTSTPSAGTVTGSWSRTFESIRTLRELRPETLVTGRYEPIVGGELIDACLDRMYRAVDFVHQATLDGINAGTDVWSLMRDIELPAELRVGQGYGKVPWAVRTIWETYVGWFKLQSTTELYPDSSGPALADLVEAAGVDAALSRAETALNRGDAVVAIRIAEAVDGLAPQSERVRSVMVAAHQQLLDNGGSDSFWENGWLLTQLQRWNGN